MFSAYFKPHSIPGTSGLFESRASVIPNMDGIFQLTFLNVTGSDIVITSPKLIGSIRPMDNQQHGSIVPTPTPVTVNPLSI